MRWIVALMLVFAAVVVGAADVQVLRPADPPAGTVGPRGTVSYLANSGDVQGELRFTPADASMILLVRGPGPGVAVADQAAVLAPLLHKALADNPGLPRLSLFLADRQGLVDRLAAVLATCKGWNAASGKPVQGDLRRFIIDTINVEDVAADLVRAFEAEGYLLSVQAAAMISEAPSGAHGGALLPTDIAYLGFVAERVSREGGTPWQGRRYRRSIC